MGDLGVLACFGETKYRSGRFEGVDTTLGGDRDVLLGDFFLNSLEPFLDLMDFPEGVLEVFLPLRLFTLPAVSRLLGRSFFGSEAPGVKKVSRLACERDRFLLDLGVGRRLGLTEVGPRLNF